MLFHIPWLAVLYTESGKLQNYLRLQETKRVVNVEN